MLECGKRFLNLNRPSVMGILNVTPDSFSDGGLYRHRDQAVAQAWRMVEAGADIIDIGGESTRPGASPVPVQEELERVVPVVEALAPQCDRVISVDTSAPEVMRAAVAAGAGMINDVRALRRPGAMEAAVQCAVPVVLMHSHVDPTDSAPPSGGCIMERILSYLSVRLAACVEQGIPRSSLLLDPGFGGGMFGKSPADNLDILRRFGDLHQLGQPLLAGVSRKSFLSHLGGRAATAPLATSLACALLLVQAGAQVVRVHDVQETVDALRLQQTVADAPAVTPVTRSDS
ncbi:MAG: dihydropteroate synthase [Kistimonas sp.]|nr:dihydropteroate synthase [Kistimonas sp.]